MPMLPNGALKLEGASEEPLKVGDSALDFSRLDQDGRPVSLADFAGQPVVLVLLGRHTNELVVGTLQRLKEIAPEIKRTGAAIVGLTTNYYTANRELAQSVGGIDFPLLDDESESFEAISTYEQPIPRGTAYPVYVLDGAGKITYLKHGDNLFDESHAPELVAAIPAVTPPAAITRRGE